MIYPDNADFQRLWNESVDARAAARALGLTARQAQNRACQLRRQGLGLKKMARGPKPRADSARLRQEVQRLGLQGLSQSAIARQLGISRQWVWQLLQPVAPPA